MLWYVNARKLEISYFITVVAIDGYGQAIFCSPSKAQAQVGSGAKAQTLALIEDHVKA